VTTQDEAKAALVLLVDPTVAPVLSDADLDEALAKSQVKDATGTVPGTGGYEPTWSLYWAAMLVSQTRAIRAMSQAQLEDFSAEGLRMKIRPADWTAVADRYRTLALAERGVATANTGLSVIEVSRDAPLATSRWPWLTGAQTNAN